MSTAHISGHIKITQEEFDEHYYYKINDAFISKDDFVVGDAAGVDTMAQKLLHDLGVTNVTVYHMFEKPRNNVGKFKTVGGFKSDEERDAAMTKASNYDIAWVRPGKENSGTAKNIKRRGSTSN